MLKTDYDRCRFVGDWIEKYDWVTDVTVREDENYWIDDVEIKTDSGDTFYIEVKAAKGKTCELHPYSGINYSHSLDFNAPWSGATLEEMDFGRYKYVERNTDISRFKGKKLGILNADTKDGRTITSKWGKLLREPKSMVMFLCTDGVVFFSHKALERAFMGYGYLKHSHTKEKGDNNLERNQLHVILDMSKGKSIKINNVPKKLLE